MSPEDIAVELTKLGDDTANNTRRIEKLEQQTEALNDIATSVKLLVSEQTHQTEAMMSIKTDVAKLDQKVETLEKKPGDRWNLVVEKIILLAVAAVVGLVFAKIGM